MTIRSGLTAETGIRRCLTPLPVVLGAVILGACTPAASETAPPSATVPPTAPAAVMRLEDARQRTLDRLDPAREPRVERAFYVTEGELRAAAPELDFDAWLGLAAEPPDPGFPEAGSDHPLAFVVASTGGMDVRAADWQVKDYPGGNTSWRFADTCLPVPASQRQPLFELWDMRSGTSIAVKDDPATFDIIDRLAGRGRQRMSGPSLPAPTVTAEPTADIRWPTPTPRLTPPLPDDADPRPLGRGEVPASLVDVMADWPAAVGSQWVYQRGEYFRSNVGPGGWERGIVTGTVDAAWQIAPDVMVSRIRQDSAEGVPGDWTIRRRSGSSPPLSWYSYQYTFPNGLVTDLKLLNLAEAREVLAGSTRFESKLQVSEPAPLVGIIQLPLQLKQRSEHAGGNRPTVRRDVDQETPAGRFDDCYVAETRDMSPGGIHDHMCRGVGTVRSDDISGSAGYCWVEVRELLRYSLPDITPVERH